MENSGIGIPQQVVGHKASYRKTDVRNHAPEGTAAGTLYGQDFSDNQIVCPLLAFRKRKGSGPSARGVLEVSKRLSHYFPLPTTTHRTADSETPAARAIWAMGTFIAWALSNKVLRSAKTLSVLAWDCEARLPTLRISARIASASGLLVGIWFWVGEQVLHALAAFVLAPDALAL